MQHGYETMITAGLTLFSDSPPPPLMQDIIGRIAPRPVFIIWAPHGVDTEALNPEYFKAAGDPGPCGRSPSPSTSADSRRKRAGALLAAEATALQATGAELLVLCTNTMHKVADAITNAIEIPFVHIADTTAQAVLGRGLKTVALLATGYTMEHYFYIGRFRELHGLDVLVPDGPDRRIVHDVIYEELCVGVIADDSRTEYRRIIADLADRGAEGMLLGCTEIDLLVGPQESPVPVFDTTRLHAHRAVDLALGSEPA